MVQDCFELLNTLLRGNPGNQLLFRCAVAVHLSTGSAAQRSCGMNTCSDSAGRLAICSSSSRC